ncbi:MAG: tRNA (guanosine(46)-N7)-methyltransferase TrmB [Eubacteriales bacterium]
MRMRKKKNLTQRMERVKSLLVEDPEKISGSWDSLSSKRPIHLEIGCGKGKFITETAAADPDNFFVGLEKVADVLVMAMEKVSQTNLSNVLFIRGDANMLENYFSPGEVAKIYLNFSDPWPAKRHQKRRLTSEGFLSIYRKILAKDGIVCLKTDNRGLFEFSIEELKRCGWRIENITFDLHGSNQQDSKPQEQTDINSVESPKAYQPIFNPAGGAVTEYEQRFASMGIPICRLEAFPPDTDIHTGLEK